MEDFDLHENYLLIDDKIVRSPKAPKITNLADDIKAQEELTSEISRYVENQLLSTYGFVRIAVPEVSL